MRGHLKYLWLVFDFFMIFFLSIEYKYTAAASANFNEFFSYYMDNPQKYIINGLIYSIPIIYMSRTEFLRPELAVRLNKNILGYVFSNVVINSIIISISVTVFYIIASFVNKIQVIGKINFVIPVTIKLIIFLMSIQFIIYSIYVIIKKIIIAFTADILYEFVFLVVMFAVSSGLNIEGKQVELIFNIFLYSNFIIGFFAFLYLIINIDKFYFVCRNISGGSMD
jgi:hypothetical protein